MARPRFPTRRLVVTTAVSAAAAIGVVQWFIQPDDFWAKGLVFVILVGAIAATIVVPYAYRLTRYISESVRSYEVLPQRIAEARATTWLAVHTNAVLGDYPIDILRVRLDQGFILFLVDVGSHLGVEDGMQFEIVAVPDMEVYGVIRAFQVEDEQSWCVLEDGEGRPDFKEQMTERLKAADVAPPSGYEVRPFMAGAFQYVIGQIQSAQYPAPSISVPHPSGLEPWAGADDEDGQRRVEGEVESHE